MKVTENIQIPNPVEGVIRAAAISDPVSQPDSVQESINFEFDSMGVATGRPGLTKYTATEPEAFPITTYGTYNQNPAPGSIRRLLAQVDNTMWSWNGAAWANVRGLSSTINKARYTQFLNLTYMVNGFDGDVIQSFDGTAFGGTNLGDLVGLKGDGLATFEGRVWMIDKSLDRLYYTDIVDPSGNIPVSGSAQYIEKISPQDGQSMTALIRSPRALLVFKQNEIFRVYSATSLDPYPAYLVGTYSQESVITAKDAIYFHHPTGFYRFQYDGQPQDISRRVIDFVNGIDRTNYEKIFGWSDNDHVYWYVGDVTIKGRVYVNITMRYTISSQVWTIYSYRKVLTAAIVYDDGNDILPLVGTSVGVTAKVNTGFDDLGEVIFCEITSRWMKFTEMYSSVQQITGATVVHQNCAGMKVDFQYDKEESKFQPVMTLKDVYADISPNIVSQDFNRMRYRLTGSYNKALPVFESVEIIKLIDKGYNQN